MPGIVGILASDSSMRSKELIVAMQDELLHKNWHKKGLVDSYEKAVISYVSAFNGDVSTRAFCEAGVYIWVYGEIYGYNINSIDVDLSGAAEVVYAAYRLNDLKDGLKVINGYYSAIILDKNKNEVKLITDRYGLQHLYYAHTNELFIFSSEQKSFIAHPFFTPAFDTNAPSVFMQNGYLLNEDSWFENIKLMEPGSITTVNLNNFSVRHEKYFHVGETVVHYSVDDTIELADELVRLFTKAIDRQIRVNEIIGVGLSGGLDSRLIAAVISKIGAKAKTFTFGNKGSLEVRIANQVAQKANFEHKVYEINSSNWLNGREEAIWWAEGVPGFQNLHNVIALEDSRNSFDVKLDGFLGDATIGGTYLGNTDMGEMQLILNRGRRRIISGPKRELNYHNVRLPFFDNDFFSLSMSIPEKLRRDSYIYKLMLIRGFPEYFGDIPWLRTGKPLSINQESRGAMEAIFSRIYNKGYKYYIRRYDLGVQYAKFMREQPGKSFISNLIQTKDSVYPHFIDRPLVLKKWGEHLNGQNRTEYIGRVISLELWLRRLLSKSLLSI